MRSIMEAVMDNLAMVIGVLILTIFLIYITTSGVHFVKDTQKSMSKATQLSYGVEE